MSGITVLVGGARAGKSGLAQRLAAETGDPVSVIATARAGDADMEQRIARHRRERPAGWQTVEEPVQLERALADAPGDHTVIVDCLTLWTTNLMLSDHDDTAIAHATECAVSAARARTRPVIVVSNEVGLGVIPASELGRTFRDTHGRVNQAWVAAARQAWWVVAGGVVPIASAAELRA